MAKKISKTTVDKIDKYKEFFAGEMDELAKGLEEFRANKEEFYRRWSQYADFNQVESLLK